jgi:hypothetical protein
MSRFKLSKIIKRITVLQAQPSGDLVPTAVYKAKRKRRKISKNMRPLERLTRRSLKASESYINTYLERHERSNRKRRNGWLRDYQDNTFKAQKKARKRLRLRRLFA